jgi:hypothetical protein
MIWLALILTSFTLALLTRRQLRLQPLLRIEPSRKGRPGGLR